MSHDLRTWKPHAHNQIRRKTWLTPLRLGNRGILILRRQTRRVPPSLNEKLTELLFILPNFDRL